MRIEAGWPAGLLACWHRVYLIRGHREHLPAVLSGQWTSDWVIDQACLRACAVNLPEAGTAGLQSINRPSAHGSSSGGSGSGSSNSRWWWWWWWWLSGEGG